MKKITFLFLLLCSLQTAFAQDNYFPSSGRVGIGTITPEALLHLNGGQSRERVLLQSEGNGSAYFDLQFSPHVTSSFTQGLAYSWLLSHRKDGYFSGSPSGGTSLEFYAPVIGGGYVAPLALKANGDVVLASSKNAAGGKVGIGTTTPQKKLDVNGDANIGNLVTRNFLNITSKEWPEIRFTTPTSNEQIRIGVAHGNHASYPVEEGDYYVYTGTTGKMPLVVRKTGNVILGATEGSVGIGTKTPGAKVDVVGGDGTSKNPTLNLHSPSTTYAWSLISLKSGGDAREDYLLGRGGATYLGGRALTIHVPSRSSSYGGTGELPKVAFVSSGANTLGYVESETGNWYMKGLVGIGTVSPESKLHIENSAGDVAAKIVSADNFKSSLHLFEGENYGFEFEYDGAHDKLQLWSRKFNLNEGVRMTWLKDGNVGIGHETPNAKLHVGGNIRATNSISVEKDGVYRVALNGDAHGYVVGRNDALETKFLINSSGTSYFNGGNVGVGTASPGEYMLAVNGDIKAKKVNVTLEGWSDFVFEENYVLRPLTEVELYIKAHKHLPDVPSEAEVLEKGVELGEMNATLLRKIEELTLYTIQQEKALHEQQRKLEKKEEQMAELLKRVEILEQQTKSE